MSQSKKDQLFPHKPHAVSDDELATIVAKALRLDFGETSSVIKRIGQMTGANLRAIKNWYEARHAPSSGHLLLLARSSPSILKFVLEQIGGEDLWDAFQLLSPNNVAVAPEAEMAICSDCFISTNVPLNVPIKRLNERQRWFLMRLKNNKRSCAQDISIYWGVTIKTARRDIGGLKVKEKIRFTGSKRTGIYELVGNLVV